VKDKSIKTGTLKEPRPKQSLSSWLKSKEPAPIPGPFREWRFPLNVLLMAFLPLLIPVILVVVPTHLALSSRSSYARVKLLESDKEAMTRRLVAIWTKFEKNIEDAVEDVLEQSLFPESGGGLNGNATTVEVFRTMQTVTDNSSKSTVGTLPSPSLGATIKYQPTLTPTQHRMITNLNSLPNLTKHLAYIDRVRNSHSIIICRNFTAISNRRGEGVVRAWADGMKL